MLLLSFDVNSVANSHSFIHIWTLLDADKTSKFNVVGSHNGSSAQHKHGHEANASAIFNDCQSIITGGKYMRILQIMN